MDSLSTYVEIELSLTSVLLEDSRVYITRTHSSPARIECGEEHTVTHDRTFSINRNCDVSDKNFQLLGTNYYSMRIDTNREAYIHRYIGSSFNHTNRTVILRLDKEDVTTHFISQDTLKVVIPSVSVTGSVIIIIIIILCVYIKICKKCNFKKKSEGKTINLVSRYYPKDKPNSRDRYVIENSRREDQKREDSQKREESYKREKSIQSQIRYETS